jgi:hemoglobin/transferrin/lactoferrin receptor protein
MTLAILALLQQGDQPGQEPKDPGRTVVISASPLKGVDPFRSPFSVDVLTSHELIGGRLSRTVPESLKELPTVSVQKTGHGQGSPFLRGFTGFRNLFLIDGIRLNGSYFREGPNQYWALVDSYLIEQMEIIRGPASVLYGSDAMGGTVNVYSRGRRSFEPGFHMAGRTVARAATAEQSIAVREEFEGNQDELGWAVGLTLREYGDIIGGDHVGKQPGTGYSEWSGDAKITLQLSPHAHVHVAVQSTRSFDHPRTHRTQDRVSWQSIPPGGPADDRRLDFNQRRDLVYAQAVWEKIGGLIDSASLTLAVHKMEETSIRVSSNGTQEFRWFNATTPGVVLKVSRDTPLGFVTAGGEYYHEDIQSDGINTTTAGAVSFHGRGEIADDSTYDMAGFFIQDEIDVGGGLSVTLGGRYTWARIDAEQVALAPGSLATNNALINPFLSALPPLEDEYQAVVGDLHLMYEAMTDWVLTAGVSQAFRAPGLDDTTSFRSRTGGQSLDLPSPGLDPERSVQFEIGSRFRHGRFEAGASAFYTILEDLIRRVPGPSVDGNASADSPKQNFSQGRLYGVEVYTSVPVGPDFTVTGGFAWTEGFAEAPPTVVGGSTPTRPLSKVNPMTGILKLKYAPPETPYWGEVVVLMVATQDHLSPADDVINTATAPPGGDSRIPPGGTPGFTVFTLRGGYALNKSVSATLAIENLTNKDYRFHGSGQNEPGINVVGGLDLRY